MSEIKLTEMEAEFVAEMRDEYAGDSGEWQHFDPDFRQKDIARLIRRGWFERRGEPPYRTYRWTNLGRSALSETRGEGK